METLTVKEIVGILCIIKNEVDGLIDDINNKILIGEINHPETSVKKIRKRRTKKKMEDCKPKSSMRNPPLPSPITTFNNLPDGDKDSTFYKDKEKKERKERKERKVKVDPDHI